MLNSIYNKLVLLFLIESQRSANPVQQTEVVVANFRKMLKSNPSLNPIPIFNLII